jgi:hypothetical protein
MTGKDLKVLHGIKDSLEDKKGEARVFEAIIEDPAKEVEQSLVSFVTYRFNKIKSSVAYEEEVKEVIMSRINEATFPQLITLLQTVQSGNASSTAALLAPFIDQSNGRTLPENLRQAGHEDMSAGAEIHKAIESKEALQAFTALSQVIDHLATLEDQTKVKPT